MFTIILGILFLAFTVFACLPMGPLNWGTDIISFLKGFAPVISVFLGIICFFIGAADMKDKQEAKQEEASISEQEEAQNS